jgi:hypothetical protein
VSPDAQPLRRQQDASDFLPLMKIDGAPEPVLQQCRDVIDQKTTGGQHENLLGVTQVLASLRWDKGLLKRLFAKEGKMIESPLLQEWMQEKEIAVRQAVILESLEARFGGPVPADVSAAVRVVQDEPRLKELNRAAITSATLDAFRQALAAQATPPADTTN